jgi:methyl coenzyme M reductase beta subunit
MNVKLIDHIAATIRRVDGNHTMGAGALAEAIVESLGADIWDAAMVEPAVDALIADGWEETHDGGTIDRQDMANIARTVLHGTFAEDV